MGLMKSIHDKPRNREAEGYGDHAAPPGGLMGAVGARPSSPDSVVKGVTLRKGPRGSAAKPAAPRRTGMMDFGEK